MTHQISRENRNRDYLYKQLSDVLREEIAAGKYKPGERLPSMDQLAATYKVNKFTVQRALYELRAAGQIYSVPALGTYVSQDAKDAPESGTVPPPYPAQVPDPEPPRPRTITIGLVSQILVPGNIGLYHTDIIEGMSNELGRHSATMMMLPVALGDSADHILSVIAQARVDAVVYLGPFDRTLLRRLIERGPPAALVDSVIEGVDVDTVLVDNRGGGFKAMEHLLSLGHQNLAIVTGSDEQWISRERVRGAGAALEKSGYPPSSLTVLQGSFHRNSGYNAVGELVRSNNLPTAIFCLNDEMAFGAMQAVTELTRLRVPEDVSVVGFDNTKWATEAKPPLTTVQVPTHFMGRLAIQRIMERVKDRQATALVTTVPTMLVIRQSTARMDA
jgi:DNA-binding LacI/PurR family transcriptional regulator/DNA-binding transcriptional regulator YhcF (GntR family)